MSERKRKRGRRRRSRSKGRVLFYAGLKADGAPKGWTMQDLLYTAFILFVFLAAAYAVLRWLLEFDFGFGK